MKSAAWIRIAALFALITASVSCSLLPWSGQRRDTALAFTMERGQPVIAATMGNTPGSWIVGSAHPRTLTRSRTGGAQQLNLGGRRSFNVNPLPVDLMTEADGILGFDVWREGEILTVDYARRLVTVGPTADFHDLATERFEELPTISLTADGDRLTTVVDTSYAGGLLLPQAMRSKQRSDTVLVAIGDVGTRASVHFGDVPQPRIGNEILREFVVFIDYRRGRIALWRDPR